jgi:hypothetical protein
MVKYIPPNSGLTKLAGCLTSISCAEYSNSFGGGDVSTIAAWKLSGFSPPSIRGLDYRQDALLDRGRQRRPGLNHGRQFGVLGAISCTVCAGICAALERELQFLRSISRMFDSPWGMLPPGKDWQSVEIAGKIGVFCASVPPIAFDCSPELDPEIGF